MILRDLREFVNRLPLSLDEYSVVYRVDKPVIALYVEDSSKEICMFHQTQEDVKKLYKTDGTDPIK